MPDEIVWVEPIEVVDLHIRAIQEHGGTAGLRDEGGLLGGLNRPQTAFFYHDPPPTLFELAALYAHGIAKAHAFLDGNKRTAFATAVLFLELNGVSIALPHDRAPELMVDLATDRITIADFAAALESAVR
ncbi:MAG: type II toxin-antitoxin system death-on-curing family toxin [Alphaproteobacteria bacterium]|nr:type II toxin-antitoxin system death-on-curing family toxin [Alphaproteobacteria bacterium]